MLFDVLLNVVLDPVLDLGVRNPKVMHRLGKGGGAVVIWSHHPSLRTDVHLPDGECGGILFGEWIIEMQGSLALGEGKSPLHIARKRESSQGILPSIANAPFFVAGTFKQFGTLHFEVYIIYVDLIFSIVCKTHTGRTPGSAPFLGQFLYKVRASIGPPCCVVTNVAGAAAIFYARKDEAKKGAACRDQEKHILRHIDGCVPSSPPRRMTQSNMKRDEPKR